MDLFNLSAKLTLDSSEYTQGLTESESLGKRVAGAISARTVAIGSVIGNFATKAISAVGNTIKETIRQSISAYADYEQLVGGIETLFGAGGKSLEEYTKEAGNASEKTVREYERMVQAQQMVMQNADKAYKTAGMSVNEYMETTTSFAASLVQSLRGDTVNAAIYADMAVQDMADNANKMGTNISLIQNAYQGFAKQNYSMLDNLKLGYGGTKKEMERLLKDAMKLSGRKFNIESLADIYEAIHIIQQEMGITGTTAKEAENTISGSVNMLKASWQNLLIAFGDPNADLDEKVDALSDSLVKVVKNVFPVFTRVLKNMWNSLGNLIGSLWNSAKQYIGTAVDEAFGDGTWDAVVKWTSEGWESIQSALNVVSSFASTAGTAIKLLFTSDPDERFEIISSWIGSEAGQTVIKFVGEAADFTQTALEWIQQKTFEIGFNFIGKISEFTATAQEWINQKTVEISLLFAGKALEFSKTVEGWIGTAQEVALNFTGKAVAFAATAKAWIDSKTQEIVLSFTGKAVAFAETVKGWVGKTIAVGIDFTGKALDFAATAKEWIDAQVKSITLSFGSTVDGWISTISDWIQNGISIAVNFFGSLFDSGEGGGGPSTVTESGFGGSGHHFAKGLWDVPFDNFAANLHRGEMVLTASQARQYRNGMTGGIDMDALVSGLVGAIRDGMQDVTVRSYLSSRDITDDVNRNTVRQLKARRFAT